MATINGKSSFGAETIKGTSGSDSIDGKGGSDFIDGGAGIDTAVFFGNRSNFTVADLDGVIRITGNGGPDGAPREYRAATAELINVEKVQFLDKTIALNNSEIKTTGSYSISPASTSISENTASQNFTITRSGDLAAETVYVSTTFTEGFANNNDYKGILNKAVSFGAGAASADVTVEIVNDASVEKNETFGLIVQKNSNDLASTYLAKSTFTITDDDSSINPGPKPDKTIAPTNSKTGTIDSNPDGIVSSSLAKSRAEKSISSESAKSKLPVTDGDNNANPVSSGTEKTTDYSISPASTSISENTASQNFTITRSGDLAAETVYVSTTFTEGFANNNDYTGILNKAVSFGAGAASADVTVEIVNDASVEKNETFGLIVQKNSNDLASTYLAKSTFTITDDDSSINPGPKLDKTIAPTNSKTGTIDSNPDGNVSSSLAKWRTEKSKSSESAKSKLPVTDGDNSTKSGLEITKDNILVAAANLSARAYSDNDDINEKIQGWKPLEATDFDLDFPVAADPILLKADFSTAESTDSGISTGNSKFKFSKVGNGDGDLLRYDFENASATVGLTILDSKRTLGISFEGSNYPTTKNGRQDWKQDLENIKAYYDILNDSSNGKKNFIPSVIEYINNDKNNIAQVLVTGHSLGGAAAQSFMQDYGQNEKFIGVTFGSPGTSSSESAPKDRFVNIQHSSDPFADAPKYFVKGSVININIEKYNFINEHFLDSYKKTVEFITSELDAKTLFRDMNIVAGTDGDDDLDARIDKNGEILLGGKGNDALKGGVIGGQDTQIFKGGPGNDDIDGDGGIDYAVYSGLRSDFAFQLDKKFLLFDQMTVADLRKGTDNDGTDTLASIERLIFTDSGLAFDLDGSAGKVAKLIGAVFGAESLSNAEYVASGLYSLDHGTSYEDLAALAITATGASSPEQVTSLLWSNVMRSTPTADDKQQYIDKLNSGTSVGELGVLFADKKENQANIDLVGLSDTGIIFDSLHYQLIG